MAMEHHRHPKPSSSTNPLLSLSSTIHQHFLRLTSDLSCHFNLSSNSKKLATNILSSLPAIKQQQQQQRGFNASTAFASLSQQIGKHVFDVAAMSGESVAKTLAGTAVWTVSNSNNEFVLVSDPNGLKSIGLLCFRQEDAEAFLAQVKLRKRELTSGARVVPITLDRVYMLKVEGIAFRFMPDPVQIQNALELRSDVKKGFDGVPVFQSDLLVVKKKNKRYCPIYFRKEDIEKELTKVARRGPSSQHIMVGCLEDVLKKMEMSEKNSGWEDLVFIPPGKSHSQHLQQVVNA